MRTEHDGEPVNWGMFGLWEVGNGNEQNKNIHLFKKRKLRNYLVRHVAKKHASGYYFHIK